MTRKLLALSILLQSTIGLSQELDPIIFTTKQENPETQMTSSVYVLEQDDIENRGNLRAVDVIRNIPGVEVVQTGVVGGTASIFIRGAESRHTVVMIDGVKIYDPTAPSRSFNLATLNSLDIERVEVLKGAQSVLYGSDAIGGVINIITKKGEGKNRLKAGIGIVKEVSAGHTFDFEKGLVYTNAYYQTTEFASDAKNKNIEDQKINKGVTVTGIFQIEKVDSETTFKMTNDFAQIDSVDSVTNEPVDNLNAYSKTFHTFFKQGFKYDFSDYEKIFLDYSYSRFERGDNTGTGLTSRDGTVMNTELRYLRDMRYSSFVAGFNRQSETFRSDYTDQEELSMNEIFGNTTVQYGNYVLESGARMTSNATFGSHIVYNLGARYNLDENHSFKTSFKTGFQAPSIYQLFGEESTGKVGNKNLGPEKSKNFEIGYDFKTRDMKAGAAFFQNNIENFINAQWNSNDNIEEATITGVDTYFDWTLGVNTLGATLALYDYELSNNQDISRRPKQSVGLNYSHLLNDEHSFGGHLTYQGERFDYQGTTKKTLDAYQVLDLNYTFTSGDLKLMGFIKNIFDTDYEVASGYNTMRRGVQINVEYIY